MSGTRKTRVYILGAGCSAGYGYPLARDFLPELVAFGRDLGNAAARLKSCVEETTALMMRECVETLDDLTARIDSGVFDNPDSQPSDRNRLRYQRIQRAKIATTAFFLSREDSAKQTSLRGYHALIREMFGDSNEWSATSLRTNCRVLTFNYDRLFETAFLSRFKVDTGQYPLYGEFGMNSGFNNILGEEISFRSDGFCFLKLHGTVGARVRLEYGEPRYYSSYDGTVPGANIQINDDRFFAHADATDPSERDPEPLLVFPHEAQFARSGRRPNSAYARYISAVWTKARSVISEANEIWVIGYRFAPDRSPVASLLAGAANCERGFIQNLPGDSEEICTMLSNKHPEIRISWRAHPILF